MNITYSKPIVDQNLIFDPSSIGQLNTMLQNGKLSINYIKEKKEIEEIANQILSWEHDKSRLLLYALNHEDTVKHILSILDIKSLHSDDNNVKNRRIDSNLFIQFPILKRYSPFVISFLYEEYCNWCDIGNFYLYLIGRSIIYDNYENEAILTGSAFIYKYIESKNIELARNFAKECVSCDNNFVNISQKIIAKDGVLQR